MTDPTRAVRPQHPVPRLLADLARRPGFRAPVDLGDLAVTGVSARTQDVRPGDLFVGLPGAAVHGASHAEEAARRGAVALLTDPRGGELAARSGLPLLLTADPRRLLGAAAGWLHRTGDGPLRIFAVTGTNGKTTTVHLIEHLLGLLGTPAGVSSTTERGSAGERAPSRLTTPEADELHALLARMVERGVQAAALEVSAQALVRSRVEGLVFDVAGFTNLSHDHLDDFGTMEAYLEAKARLLRPGLSRRAVICVDDPWTRSLAERVAIPVVTVSTSGTEADWTVSEITAEPDGTAFSLRGPAGQHLRTRVGLPGEHQAANAALAIVMLVSAGYALGDLERALRPRGLQLALPGRLEHVPGSGDPAVYLDVAHTPDAIAKALGALRPLTSGRLVVLFGADGDRDASKREPMGRVAAAGADLVIVHDHHSRFEDPDRIRSTVLDGARAGGAEVQEVRDPALAVRRALAEAGPGGTVLWAGTGRTDYRDIGGTKHPYSFWREAQRAVEEAEGRVGDLLQR